MTRLVLLAALVFALPAHAAPCVEHADGSTTCTAEASQAVKLEIVDLRKAVADAVAREAEQRELRAADAKEAEKELVAARVRIAALEAAPVAVLPWVAVGAAGGAVVVAVLVIALRR